MKDESAATALSAVCCARTMFSDTFRLGSIQHCLLQDALDVVGMWGLLALAPSREQRMCATLVSGGTGLQVCLPFCSGADHKMQDLPKINSHLPPLISEPANLSIL